MRIPVLNFIFSNIFLFCCFFTIPASILAIYSFNTLTWLLLPCPSQSLYTSNNIFSNIFSFLG